MKRYAAYRYIAFAGILLLTACSGEGERGSAPRDSTRFDRNESALAGPGLPGELRCGGSRASGSPIEIAYPDGGTLVLGGDSLIVAPGVVPKDSPQTFHMVREGTGVVRVTRAPPSVPLNPASAGASRFVLVVNYQNCTDSTATASLLHRRESNEYLPATSEQSPKRVRAALDSLSTYAVAAPGFSGGGGGGPDSIRPDTITADTTAH
jgi:hypothetical protein